MEFFSAEEERWILVSTGLENLISSQVSLSQPHTDKIMGSTQFGMGCTGESMVYHRDKELCCTVEELCLSVVYDFQQILEILSVAQEEY